MMSAAADPWTFLICAECGQQSSQEARGWRGYLTDDGEAVMFCPGVRRARVRQSIINIGRRLAAHIGVA